jgi:hypothetical protein
MRRSQISRPSIVGSTMSTLRISASRFSACAGEYSEPLRFRQMLERHLQRITEKRHQHMCLHPLFQLMEERPDSLLALQSAKCGFHFRQKEISKLRLNLTNHFLLLCSPFVRILPPFTTIRITILWRREHGASEY